MPSAGQGISVKSRLEENKQASKQATPNLTCNVLYTNQQGITYSNLGLSREVGGKCDHEDAV